MRITDAARLLHLHDEIRRERPTDQDVECLVISSPTPRDSEYYTLLMRFFDDWLEGRITDAERKPMVTFFRDDLPIRDEISTPPDAGPGSGGEHG